MKNIFSGAFILLWIAVFFGWIMNIYKLAGMFGEEISTWFIARIVGIFFAPLGAVLGYM